MLRQAEVELTRGSATARSLSFCLIGIRIVQPPKMQDRLDAGTVLSHFEIVSHLGSGGMGEVYKARDTALDRPLAIKIIPIEASRDSSRMQRFVQEAKAASALNHPNIVTVYEIGSVGDGGNRRNFIAMELIEGETLRDLIAQRISPSRVVEIIGQVTDGLAKAHAAGIVHRDLKPENIMVTREGLAKILDFGLAKLTSADASDPDQATAVRQNLTKDGTVVGTVNYMSPEQLRGAKVDHRSDIFSLGCLLYEMAAGRQPFHGVSAADTMHNILFEEPPPLGNVEFEPIARKALAKLPEDRYQSSKEFAEALRGIPKTITSAPAIRERSPSRKRWVSGIALTASVMCIVAAVALFFTFAWQAKHPPLREAKDERLVVAVAPFWGPDDESTKEGRTMAALVQQAIVARLGSAAKVIGIDETKTAVRDTDSARALGERTGATAVIWGQAFALRNEREIQPSLTLVPRKQETTSNFVGAIASSAEIKGLAGDLPSTPEAIRMQSQATNQIELRKTSAEGIGDLVTYVAAMHLLATNQPQRALELLTQMRRTPDALYQKAICLTQMKRDDDAARELKGGLAQDPAHAPSLALLADIDARAFHFADAAVRLRAAAATGRHFTTSEGAIYNDTLYINCRRSRTRPMGAARCAAGVLRRRCWHDNPLRYGAAAEW